MISIILAFYSIITYAQKNFYISLMAYLFLLTDGFQIISPKILTYGSFSGTTLDPALVVFIFITIKEGYYLRKLILLKPIIYFGYLLVIIAFLSLALYGYNIYDVFRGGRNYIFIFSILLFTKIPPQILKKILTTICVITVIQSLLFLAQIVLHKSILNGGEGANVIEGTNFNRYYNSPKFLDLSLLTLLFSSPFKGKKLINILFIIILFAAVVGPLHRSYIIAYFFLAIIYLFTFNSIKKKILYSVVLSVLGVGLLTISLVRMRITEALDELLDYGAKVNMYASGVEGGTFAYRVNHFIERFNYLLTQPLGFFVGIGFLDEKTPQAAALPFKLGLFNKVLNRIDKVYTPDIVWSSLVLSTGILGMIIFTLIFIKLLRFFFQNRNYQASIIGFCLIILSFFTSFFSVTLISPTFLFSIFLITHFVIFQKFQENKDALLQKQTLTYN